MTGSNDLSLAQGAEYWRGWETEAYSMVNWSPVQITWVSGLNPNNAGSYIILHWNVDKTFVSISSLKSEMSKSFDKYL